MSSCILVHLGNVENYALWNSLYCIVISNINPSSSKVENKSMHYNSKSLRCFTLIIVSLCFVTLIYIILHYDTLFAVIF